MIEISLNKAVKSYGFNNILDELNLEIKENEIIALIGENGCGKSTILKIIKGIENLNSGTLSIRKNRTIGMLPQIPPLEKDDVKVIDILNRSTEEINEIEIRLKKLEEKMMQAQDIEKIYNKYLKTEEEFRNKGGYEKEERLGKIIKGFKLENILERDYNTLSGGEKTITTFASLMLNNPNILLLDEPTNHLDIETIEWLEKYLKSYNGTILIVSHDRYFLDKISSKTILISDGKEIVFNGNYTYYLRENEQRILNEFKAFKDQQKQIEAMKSAIKKLREFGRLGDNERFFKRANCMEKRLEKIEKINKPKTNKLIPLNFEMNNRSGKEVLKINKLNLSYDKVLFEDANMLVRYQDHICLMGKNGSGKSTLIKQILENKNLLGSNINLGYIPQEIRFENDNRSILEEARQCYIGDEQHLRSALFKFMFYGENIHKKLSKLSGGEKVRLKLFILMNQKANFLILDEPTNHIDITTREILEDALNEFQGTLLFVSHDRYFINSVATKIVNIENNKLIEYVGNYDYFKRHYSK